jgi:hypothetical protein
MKKIITCLIILSMLFTTFNCGSTKALSVSNPPIGVSAKIKLVDGTVKEGVLLKKEGNILKYVDTVSKIPEDIEISKIMEITHADRVYDLQGDEITEQAISGAKGSGKTIGYGVAGVVLGAAVGFGLGAVYNSVLENPIKLIYPMIGLGIAGGIWLGIKGSHSDREDAIDEIRTDRYRVYQKQLEKEIEEQKKQIEQEKQEKEKREQKQNPGN